MYAFREEKNNNNRNYRKFKTIHLFKLSRCGLLLYYFKTPTYLIYEYFACGADKKSKVRSWSQTSKQMGYTRSSAYVVCRDIPKQCRVLQWFRRKRNVVMWCLGPVSLTLTAVRFSVYSAHSPNVLVSLVPLFPNSSRSK